MKNLDWLLSELGPAARAASANAHAPCSGYAFGASASTGEGEICRGCNVDSDSLGLTKCAERNALGAATAAGAGIGSVKALVIFPPGDKVLPTCGACHERVKDERRALLTTPFFSRLGSSRLAASG